MLQKIRLPYVDHIDVNLIRPANMLYIHVLFLGEMCGTSQYKNKNISKTGLYLLKTDQNRCQKIKKAINMRFYMLILCKLCLQEQSNVF